MATVVEWYHMTNDERKLAATITGEGHVSRRVNQATIGLMALLILTGLAHRFGLLDPILTYGVGGGLAFCLLIVQLDRLHAHSQQREHAQDSTPEDEDTRA
jgi:hypothetical protein